MREIIFRAWYKPDNTMWWFDVMWGNCHAGGGYIGMIPSEEQLHYRLLGDNRIPIDPDDCELMQYTGLKDKKDKEIYEGDITERSYDDGSKERGVIIFQDASFLWKCSTPFPIGINTLHSEVIGNIYENPGLLKESK